MAPKLHRWLHDRLRWTYEYPDVFTIFPDLPKFTIRVPIGGQLLDSVRRTLENSTVCRIVTMEAPLLLTSGLVRYEAVLRGCGTSPVEE